MERISELPLLKIFFAGIILLAIYFTFFVPIELAGDIVEYHGITESLIKNHTIRLTDTVAYNINTYLSPDYLKDPGYYIKGVDGERYPVHFVLYSFLSLPIRLILKLFALNELLALRLTNLAILTATMYYVMKRFIPQERQRLALLITTFTSPLVTFLIWPGPDLYYLCFMLISLFFFFDRKYILSIAAMSLASLHSQPLIVLTAALTGYYVYHYAVIRKSKELGDIIQVKFRPLLHAVGVFAIALIPYTYNLYIFGRLSPWTILEDGWTKLNGFGIHNTSLQKFIEQFFDLNFGLFWYAPLTLILGSIVIIHKLSTPEKNKILFVVGATLATAFFYQTNPAWHYGTAGFGPSRHAIFLLPMFIYFSLHFFEKKIRHIPIFIGLLIIWQLIALGINGFFTPKLSNTLRHSPYATYALNTFPAFYNPTPEIFVDRTNNIDIQHPTSAIYKINGVCKKAYALRTDKTYVEKTCGALSPEDESFFEDPFQRKANFQRSITTNQITFWPDPTSCGKEYFTSETAPYVCMRSIDEVMKATAIYEPTRFTKVPGFEQFPGIWRLQPGPIVDVNIPPGYVIDYSSFEGKYINY